MHPLTIYYTEVHSLYWVGHFCRISCHSLPDYFSTGGKLEQGGRFIRIASGKGVRYVETIKRMRAVVYQELMSCPKGSNYLEWHLHLNCSNMFLINPQCTCIKLLNNYLWAYYVNLLVHNTFLHVVLCVQEVYIYIEQERNHSKCLLIHTAVTSMYEMLLFGEPLTGSGIDFVPCREFSELSFMIILSELSRPNQVHMYIC